MDNNQINVGDIKQWRGYCVEILALNNKDRECMIGSRDPDRWLEGRPKRLTVPYNQIYNLPRKQPYVPPDVQEISESQQSLVLVEEE